MHTATRLALPVIDRVRAPAIRPATICAYGLYAPLNEALLRAARRLRRARAGGGSGPGGRRAHARGGDAGRRALRRHAARPGHAPAARVHPARSRRPAGARALRVAAVPGWPADASSAPPRRRAAASIAAATVRSCRSTTASSASCRSRSCWPTCARRWRPGAEHITFGDPDFFNGPTHARRIVEALHARVSRRHLRRDHQGRAPARARRAAAGAARHRLRCSSRARSSRSTTRCWRSSTRATRAPTSIAVGGAVPRRSGSRSSPTFVAFTPWTTLDGYRDLLDVVDELGLVRARGAGAVDASGCSSPGGRGCSSSTTMPALVGPFDPAHADAIRGATPIRASTPLQQRGDGLVGHPRLEASRPAALRRWCASWRTSHLGRAGAPSLPRTASRGDSLPERALVLLSGAHRRAGGSALILAGERTGEQGCAARAAVRDDHRVSDAHVRRGRGRASASSSCYATDRCDQLDDPWRDRRDCGSLHDEAASVDAVAAARSARPARRRARGRRSADGAGRAGRRGCLACRGTRPTARGASRDKRADRASAAGARRLAGAVITSCRRPARCRRRSIACLFPCVVKPLVLSGSRGVIRADDAPELARPRSIACARCSLRSPDVRALRDPDGRRHADRGVHPRRRVRASRAC